MQKIMFNDRYGLTQAVIEGMKAMTRRLADPKQEYERMRLWHPSLELKYGIYGYTENDGWVYIKPKYRIGETVAVAQSYEQIYHQEGLETMDMLLSAMKYSPGWGNKMYTRSDLMPHQIRITGIRIERLQGISDADCMKEGIRYIPEINKFYFEDIRREEGFYFGTPREAFAALIDKVSGRGTWKSNPYVVVYEFELVK